MPDRTGESSFPRGWCLALFAFSFIVRLLFLWFWERAHLESIAGYDNYVVTAQYWAGFLTDIKELDHLTPAPTFVGLCALLFKIAGGPNLAWVRVMNILFSSATCVVTALFAAQWMRPKAAAAAGLLAAITPSMIYFSPHLESEPLFVLFEMLFFLTLTRRPFGESLNWTAGAGFMAALATLTRPIFILFVPFMGIVPLAQQKWNRRLFLAMLLFFTAWLGPFFAWKFGTKLLYGDAFPVHATAGRTLYIGIALKPEDRAQRIAEVHMDMENQGLTQPAEQDAFLMKKSLDYIRAHPFEYARILAAKLVRYWRPAPYAPFPSKARWAIGTFYTVFFILVIGGMWALREKFIELLAPLSLFVCLSGVHSIMDTTLRYRLPLEPLLCLFAAAGLSALAVHFPRQTRDRS